MLVSRSLTAVNAYMPITAVGNLSSQAPVMRRWGGGYCALQAVRPLGRSLGRLSNAQKRRREFSHIEWLTIAASPPILAYLFLGLAGVAAAASEPLDHRCHGGGHWAGTSREEDGGPGAQTTRMHA